MQLPYDAPDEEWLEEDQARLWVSKLIPPTAWAAWIADGRIPPPRELSRQNRMYHRHVLVAIKLLITSGWLPLPEKSRGKSGVTQGNSGATDEK